jgi:1,2-diacylglycerol 3-alpha-glucosyltransferase
MKIVVLCDFYNETLEYQENLLTKYYVKHGHSVTIITSTFESVFDFISDRHDKTIPEKVSFYDKTKIIRLKYLFNLMNRLRPFTSIYNILIQERPDVIYLHDIILNIIEVVKYKKLHPNCKIILDYHADYSNSAKNWLSLKILHGVIRKWFLDVSKQHISKFFPVTPASAKFLNEVYGIPHSDMELLPLGADTDLGKETKKRKEGERLRKLFAIPKSDVVIFTGGKLTPAKKTELLIKAFKNLLQPNIHLFIVGDTSESDQSYKDSLLNLCDGVPNIHFTGWISNVDTYSYLDMSDIAIFPASQSILWQRSISMGLPLVVGDAGDQDASYLNVYGNIISLQHDQINVEIIQKHLDNLIHDDALRYEMALGAEKVTNELLNWDILINKTLLL